MNPRILILTNVAGEVERIIADGNVVVHLVDGLDTLLGDKHQQTVFATETITIEEFSRLIRFGEGPVTSAVRTGSHQTQVAPPAHTPEPAASHNAPPVLSTKFEGRRMKGEVGVEA